MSGLDASVTIPLPGTGRSIPLIQHVEPDDVAAIAQVQRVTPSG